MPLTDMALCPCVFGKHGNVDMPKSNNDNTAKNAKIIHDFEDRTQDADVADVATGEKAKKRLVSSPTLPFCLLSSNATVST